MERLTVNQVMLLLDIHRGTNVEAHSGTRAKDLAKLRYIGYVMQDVVDTTDLGNRRVELIKGK